MADPFKYFRIEARELVDALAKDALALEKHGGADVVARMLRGAHTLKGAARIVKHRALAELAHELESLMAAADQSHPPGRRDALMGLVDSMNAEVERMSSPSVPPVVPVPVPVPMSVPARDPDPESGSGKGKGKVMGMGTTSPPTAGPDPLDSLLDGLAELQAQLARLRESPTSARIDQLERELRTVRGDAERLRLVAARTLWTALERTARDVATASGKDVEVATEGGDVRVDAAVLAALQPALVQLVRNAVAHGIANKGRVTISARQLDSRVSFTVRDDGRGIDLAAVRRGLEKRGVALPADAPVEAVIRELLRGGVSTSATVTEVAGRGIGLDLVRDVVHRLGGEVTATSAATGATFTITVPVSLHATSVVTVAAGDLRAAVPRDSVRSTRVHRDADVVLHGGARALALDGALVPYASIGAVLGHAGTDARSVVIVAHASGDVALGVDRVIGVDDVIARARPRAAPIRRIVAALSVDHEARPIPILDPGELAARIRTLASTPAHAPAASAPALAPILVVDDSLTTRMLEQSILESAGYTVELAASAEEALDKVQRTRYALVLVDVEMPGMDGFSFVAELRARPALAALPAILVTSRNAAEDHRRGEAVGANDYIVKGEFDQTFLLRRIGELVG